MIRIKAGVPRRARPRTRFRRPLRRALALGLPTVWGAIAITYKLTCPLAQQNGLGARIVTSAVFFAVGTGLVVQVRRSLLRELRQSGRSPAPPRTPCCARCRLASTA